jgi:hypothetical protein
MIPLVTWMDGSGRGKFTGVVLHWERSSGSNDDYAVVACNETNAFHRVWRDQLKLTGWRAPMSMYNPPAGPTGQ